ncbi:MAG: hypothetical protein QG657_5698 [Acidobacteriota bacterium]|nr:hypothetical protein [Acidobacteriota bacterium]
MKMNLNLNFKRYPLSHAQKRIYYTEKKYPGTGCNNITYTVKYREELDKELLEQAINKVLEKNEGLRSRMVELEYGAEPLQYFSPHEKYCPEVVAFSGPDSGARLAEWLDMTAKQPFPVLNCDLFYFALVKYNEDESGYLMKLHHLVADGRTVFLLAAEIHQFYEDLKAGKAVDNQPYPSYRQYLDDEGDYLRSTRMQEDRESWYKTLLPLPPEVKLWREKTGFGDIVGAQWHRPLPDGLRTRVHDYCRENKTTVYKLLLSAFSIFISRAAGVEDFVIVIAHHNRAAGAREKMTGMFVSTVPLRFTINNNFEFRHFVEETGKQINDIVMNRQRYPFDRLAVDIKEKTGVDAGYLANINFIGHPGLAGDAFRLGHLFLDSAPNPLSIHIDHHNKDIHGTLELEWNYQRALFSAGDMGRFHRCLVNILDDALENPGKKISELQWVSPAEKEELLFKFNDTDSPYRCDRTLHQLFAEQANRTPDHIAVTGSTSLQITYRQLDEQSGRWARLLIEKGVQPDTIVGIMAERSVEMIIGIVGILKSNAAYLPIDPQLPRDRIDYMLKDSRAKLLAVANNQEGEKVRRWEGEKVLLESIIYDSNHLKGCPRYGLSDFGFRISDFNSLAYLIYTSGTTGRPKGVLVEHRGIVNLVYFHREVFNIYNTGAVLRTSQVSNQGFDAMAFELWPCLSWGGVLHIVPDAVRIDPAALKNWLIRNGITASFQPTAMVTRLLEEEWPVQGCLLQVLWTAGDRLTAYLGKHYPFRLYNLYGPTEDTVWTTWFETPVKPGEKQPPLIGKPIANHRVYILGKDLGLQPIGIAGELCISGVGVARGYLNNPELTNQKFLEVQKPFFKKVFSPRRVYRTGDLARWLDDGNIEFLGRIDTQVKIRGFRIELGEIESRLAMHPSVKEAAVTAREDKPGEKNLCAYITPRQAGTVDARRLKEYLAHYLPPYMVPQFYVEIGRLPLTPAGKVDRRGLPGPRLETGGVYTAPRGPVEEALVEIWRGLLSDNDAQAPSIGIDDNFFELGGHSLKAMILAGRIEKDFHVKCSLAYIFNHPTIRELARLTRESGGTWDDQIPPVEEKEYYPLTSAQKGLFFLDRWENIGTSYHMTSAFSIKGKPDIERLKKVTLLLIERHESLRTSFHLLGDEPVQRIHDPKVFGSPETFFQKGFWPPGAIIKSFDLSCAPLLRVGVISLSAEETLLVFDMHHIIGDGASMGIFFEEFSRLYNSGDPASEAPRLPLPGTRYRDFAQWRNRPGGADIKEQEEYWLDLYPDAGDIPRLELPADFPRPGRLSFEGDQYRFSLTPGATDRFRQSLRTGGVTPYMGLLAAFILLLYKYTGQKDIVVGTAIMGRGRALLENVIGMFVDTLAIRHFPHGEMPYTVFLSQVKDSCIKAFENRDMQLEALAERLNIARDPGHNPLFDVLFIWENLQAGKLTLENALVEPYPLEKKNSKFDLTFLAEDNGDNISFVLSYRTALFKKETIARLAGHFTRVLDQVVQRPGMVLAAVDLLKEEEKRQLVEDFNRTAAPYPAEKTLHQLFEEQVEKTPDRFAVVGAEEEEKNSGVETLRATSLQKKQTYLQMSYRQLKEQSDRIAGLLIEKGVQPDTIVAIKIERSIEMIIGILGILKSGGAYMPIDPGYPQERIDYMLKDSNAKILLDLNTLKGCPRRGLHHSSYSSHLAYLIYTSGTTGKPKAAAVEHRNAVNTVTWFIDFHRVGIDTRIIQLSDYTFDASVNQVFGALLSGAGLYIAANEVRMDMEKLRDFIIYHRVNIINFVPVILKELLCHVDKLDSLHTVISGAEKLDEITKEAIIGKGYRLVNQYGPTETAIDALAQECSAGQVSLGKPIYNVNVYILDNHERIVPRGIVGELYIAGAGVARGYLNQPELTAEKFIKDRSYKTYILYKTGDLVRWLPDGNIQFLGRGDQQVKIRGFRIELGEIESCLAGYPLVKEVVVMAREDKSGEKSLCAYITPRQAGTVDARCIKEYIAHRLPHYMIPRYIVEMVRMPVTPGGKVDRRALPDPRVESGGVYTAPRGPVEKALVEIWRGLLFGKAAQALLIGIDDNFFEMGGDSLKAMILAGRIEKNFHIKCPLTYIFQFPTIRELAHRIRETSGTWDEQIPPVEEKEYYPLSSAQKRLFFLDRWENIGTSYHITFAFSVKGKLDIERLEKVSLLLIERHECLRTSFHLMGDEPVQRIHKSNVFLGVEGAVFSKKAPWSFIQPFDLSCAPLFRVGVSSISAEEALLIFDMHHIIGDGTSTGVFFQEFSRLYNSGDPGVEVGRLPLPGVRYRDFSQWQNRLMESGKINEQENYWLNLYPDVDDLPRLELPADFPRPGRLSFAGDHCRFSLSSAETHRFRQLIRAKGVTPYMGLLAAFILLLYKYTGQEDMVIGAGVMGRKHAGLENIIGMFVNTLAIRYFPHGEMTYDEFLGQVRGNNIKAFDNQDVQFEALVERLSLPRDPGHNPLFDVLFVLQNFQPGELTLEGAVLTPYPLEKKNSKFDLTLFAQEKGEVIHFSLEYCTALFKRETMERMAGYFVRVLNQVCETPGIPLDMIELLSAEEKRQLVEDFNSTAAEYPAEKTIHQLFAEQVQKTPDHIALFGESFRPVKPVGHVRPINLTFLQLQEESNQLANYLYSEIVMTPGECVAILLDRSIDRVMAMLGVLKSASAYIPLESSLPEERIKTIINDGAVRTIISQKKYIRLLNRLQWECCSLQTILCVDSEDIHAEPEVEQNELMDTKLWEYVGETAIDEITGGGWLSSYTGEPIPPAEMVEYGENVLRKLEPLLHEKMRVLEIGCATGITMFRIAPRVGFYYGTDLSPVIIEKNKQRVKDEGCKNIRLECMAAHEIDWSEEGNFDLVIINSVIQCFHGHNYLRQVLRKVIAKISPSGYLFIGDIMDQQLKHSLIREMQEFKKSSGSSANPRTKTDWSAELFISRDFFEDLQWDIPEIGKIEFSRKIYAIENELTKFRYDALLTIDKLGGKRRRGFYVRYKYQDDMRALREYGNKMPVVKSGEGACSPAYVIYTSGTTGKPRGVIVEHRALVNLCWWHHGYYDITERDRAVQYASFSFDASVWEVFPYLVKGAVLSVIPNDMLPDVEELNNYFEKHQVTIAFLPTPLCEQFMAIDNYSLRVLLTGGDKLHHFIKRNYRLYNNYGPTENAVVATAYRVEESSANISIGAPIANNQIYILSKDNFHLQPVGVPGELCIVGDSLARGYLNNPELSAEKFIKSFAGVKGGLFQKPPLVAYKTGDLARWLAGGNIEFLGRIDQQVKIRGFRIELEEIRRRLEMHEAVQEAVVIVREDAVGEKKICAYIVLRNTGGDDFGAEITAKLSEFLAIVLPEYMIPTHFVLLEKIPVNSSGKIDRKALPSPASLAIAVGEYTAPRDSLEKILAEIWTTVLNPGNDKTAVGIDTDFFKAGGHSLKVAALVSRIHRELQVRVLLTQVFSSPTIRGLAEHIRGADRERWPGIEPAPVRPNYPLSPAQRRIYILDRMGAVYNMPRVLTVTGNLDVQKLESALKQMIQRHESLRTSFHIIDDQPVQEIHDNVEFNIESYDSATDEHGQTRPPGGGSLLRFIRAFDLSKAPLLRVRVIKEAEEQYVLMIDTHHIVSDGISQGIFMKELWALYAGKSLPPPRVQYKDYAWWQHQQRENKENAWRDMETFWVHRFHGEIPPLELPYDFPRPPAQNYRGKTISFEFSPVETQALKSICSPVSTGAAVTLYMAALALFNVLLAKLSGTEDIVIGTPIAGRSRPDLQATIGMFVGTLAMRHFPAPEKNFDVFLEEIRERTLAAFENQEYPFEELVEKVGVTRDAGRSPLFDVMLAVQNIDRPGIEIPGLIVKPRPFDYSPANFDLFLQCYESGDIIKWSLNYSISLFEETTIRRFIVYFKEIIKSVSVNPRQRIADIDMLPEDEKIQVLYDFNRTAVEYPAEKTIHQLFAGQVERTPDGIALVGADLRVCPVCLTYRQLNEQSNRLAGLLMEKGVLADSIVGIMIERSVEMIIALLGVLKSGGAYLPIDPQYPQYRIDYMLRDSHSRVLVIARDLDEKEIIINCQLLIVNCKLLIGRPHRGLHHSSFIIHHSNHLAYVIYTSGSTGRPKGVMIENRAVANFITGISRVIPFTSADSILSLTTISFDIFVLETLLPLTVGSRVVIGTPDQQTDPLAFAAVMERENITHLQLTPSRLQLFMDYGESVRCLERLHYLLVGGELFPDYLLQKVQTFIKGKLYNLYGPTETTVWSMCRCVEKGDRGINIGMPLANTHVYILASGGGIQPLGVPGELCVGGVGVTRGYLNNPGLSAQRIIKSFAGVKGGLFQKPPLVAYKTGDLARRLSDGSIEFLGRIDQQVKIRGFRIELGEIEALLLKHYAIEEAVVVLSGRSGSQQLCAYVKARQEVPVPELKDHLARWLPAYMIPNHFVFLERVPLTPSGKIDRNALPSPELGAGIGEYNVPRDKVEKNLLNIWSEILETDRKRIGIDSNFFQLGGHSLRVINMTMKIHREFSVKIGMTEVFRNPTIRGLARLIRGAAGNRLLTIPPAETREYYDLSSAQKRLYIVYRLDPQSTVYNMTTRVILEGWLDWERIENTFRELIRRHESLRTSFQIIAGNPVQRIHEKAAFEIEYYNISAKAPEENSLKAKEYAEEKNRYTSVIIHHFIRPFDLSRVPLLRVGLLKMEEYHHILMVDMPHIIADGLAHRLLVEEFMALYRGEALYPLQMQYKDFSQWQNSPAMQEEMRKQETFWLNRFAGDIPAVQIPLDYPRTGIRSPEGSTMTFEMVASDAQKLREMAAEEGATLFMVILALFNVLLYKLSGQEDIVIGTAVAGRNHPDLERVIGIFLNTLALRNFPRGQLTFKQFLTEVKENTLAAFDHQDYQFEELVQKVMKVREKDRRPLFDVMFGFTPYTLVSAAQKSPIEKNPDALQFRPYKRKGVQARFDITFTGADNGETFVFLFEYCTALFKSKTMERFAGYFKDIAASVTASPQVLLKDIFISTELAPAVSDAFQDDENDFKF